MKGLNSLRRQAGWLTRREEICLDLYDALQVKRSRSVLLAKTRILVDGIARDTLSPSRQELDRRLFLPPSPTSSKNTQPTWDTHFLFQAISVDGSIKGSFFGMRSQLVGMVSHFLMTGQSMPGLQKKWSELLQEEVSYFASSEQSLNDFLDQWT